MVDADQQEWQRAQEAEKGHWAALWQDEGSSDRQELIEHEIAKGDFIFNQLMAKFDVKPLSGWVNKCVLDVACGPLSQIARAKLGKTGAGVDPLKYPDWVYEAYSKDDFEVFIKPFEQMDASQTFDVIVMYNALQHFADLNAVAEQAKRLLAEGGQVYVCEYLEVPMNEAHVQFLTKDRLDRCFAAADFKVESAIQSVKLRGLVERPGGHPIDLYVARLKS